MVRETLLDYFRTVAKLRGEYLVYDDGFRPHSYTYASFARCARNFAAQLRDHRIGPGDRVVLWSENRPASPSRRSTSGTRPSFWSAWSASPRPKRSASAKR
jgi:acyl-CoA synthetase (AMP-forming)/AMP-acid ligase II